MLPKATNTPERLDTITGAQREDSGDGMLSKQLLSIGRCSSGNHGGNSSSGSCMTTAIDMAGDGESARGGGAAHEVNVVCLRRQPHPAKFLAIVPPSGASSHSSFAPPAKASAVLPSNMATLERLRG